MELGFPLNFTTSLSLLVPVIILLLFKKWIKPKPNPSIKYYLPPGPKKLPIIGDLHRMSLLPFRTFRDLAKQYGPLMHLKLGEATTIVVSSPQVAKIVLKEHDPSFADRPQSVAIKILWYNYSDLAFSPYGEFWRQMRKICVVELLSTKNVRSFGSIRKQEVSQAIRSISSSSGQALNVTDSIFTFMSAVACKTMFGDVGIERRDMMIKLMKEVNKMAGGFEMGDLFPSSKLLNFFSLNKRKLMVMRRKADVLLDEIIKEHRDNNLANKKMSAAAAAKDHDEGISNNNKYQTKASRGNDEEDLVDVFLRVQASGEMEFPIVNDNIKAVIFDMFAAGTETSSTSLDWTMTELIRNPRVMAKAQTEVRQVLKNGGTQNIEEADLQKLEYLKLVLKESLRLHPPVPILPRASREERVVNGYTIPANAKVLVNAWGIQRDPKYWKDPESFEPERFENNSMDFVGSDFQYLPFGSGRRICPGISFGMASLELPLALLLYNFNWSLPDGVRAEDLDMTENPGLSATRKTNLFLVPTPYII